MMSDVADPAEGRHRTLCLPCRWFVQPFRKRSDGGAQSNLPFDHGLEDRIT
jgi:hypothetical protein